MNSNVQEIPVGKSKNLKGQKFDHLTVMFRTSPPKGKKPKGAWWACKCDCGNPKYVIIRADRFKNEKNFSCGCDFKKTGRPIDTSIQINKKYGKWTVKEFKGVINTHASYLCECECGHQKIITGSQLKSGKTKSCPKCSNGNKIDITGQRFGKLIALCPTEKRQRSFVIWKCQCDCGNICEVPTGYLRNGSTKSCGCLGISYGEFHIQELLNEQRISYTVQKKFKNCKLKNSSLARFDFFIEDKYIIEYDGEQHFNYRYENNYHGWNNKENFEKTRKNDLIKNKYCFNNNIPLIRIPYDADYTFKDLKLETTRFLLTPENEKEYYESRMR